MNQIQITPG
jgi:hypothetical protein